MKIRTILFALLLLGCAARGASQPKIGLTELVKANQGLSTNQIVRNGTNVGSFTGGTLRGNYQIMQTNWPFFNYTNANPAIGVSFSSGSHRWTLNGTTVEALQLKENDDVVETTAAAYQTTVSKIVDSTHFETFDYAPGITRSASPNFFILRSTLHAVDIGGLIYGGGINEDGGYSISGAEGFNSAKLKFMYPGDGRANMSLGYYNYGVAGLGLGFYNHLGGGYAQGNVLWISTNATEGSLIITSNSMVTLGSGESNLAQLYMPNISTQALASATAMVTTDANGKFYESALPVAGSTNWLTDPNGNGYGVNFFALKDRNGVAIMQLWSPTSTNGGNASMEIYGGGVGAPFKVTGREWVTDKVGVYTAPSDAGANLEVGGLVGGTVNPLAHIGTNANNGWTVSTNGNVGVGTNAPGVALDVMGVVQVAVGSVGSPSIRFNNSANSGLISTFAGGMDFVSSGASSVRMQGSGGINLLNNSASVGFGASTDVSAYRLSAGVLGIGTADTAKPGGALSASNAFFGGITYHTNGIASYASTTNVTIVSTGITNTSGRLFRLFGLTGVNMTQNDGSNSYTLGTITAPFTHTMQPNEYVTGTSIAVAGGKAL